MRKKERSRRQREGRDREKMRKKERSGRQREGRDREKMRKREVGDREKGKRKAECSLGICLRERKSSLWENVRSDQATPLSLPVDTHTE